MLGKLQFNSKEYTIKIWNGEILDKVIAVDTETTIVPSYQIPELVVTQAFDGSNSVYYIEKNKLVNFFLKHYDNKFVMHNAVFDLSVLGQHIGLSRVYELYSKDQILDTSILYRLLHLGTIGHIPPKYSLAKVVKRFLNIELDKDADVRMTFGQYAGKPLSEMSPEHLIYAAKDPIATLEVYYRMLPHIYSIDTHKTLLSHHVQAKGAWALKKIHENGIGFDLDNRDAWLDNLNTELHITKQKLADWGWVRGQKGCKERYAEIVTFLGIADKLPRSDKSNEISSKREDLEPYSKLQFIPDYLKFIELEKASTFVRDVHASRLHPRYNTLVNTGRTSCSSPNVQQMPRIGGIREMFIPRPGMVFVDVDYSTLELCTLAQIQKNLYGESVMMDNINEGQDLHKYYASVLYSKPVDEITKDERQSAKAANFGFPGGLGIDTFKKFASGYGVVLTSSEAQHMKDKWFDAFPEEEVRLKAINEGMVYTETGRARADATYCAVANTPFQGLAADGAKIALFNLVRAGYRICAFVHDQVLIEHPKEDAERALAHVQQIMIDSMREVTPDVKITTEGQILERWSK